MGFKLTDLNPMTMIADRGLGLFDKEKGKSAGTFIHDPASLLQMQREAGLSSNADLANSLAEYGEQGSQGKSLAEIIAPGKTIAEQRQGAYDALATGATSGSRFATEQVQNNPILGQLFGKDGTLSRTAAEEQELASRGFSLKPEDYEAYGQASGDVARMFGQAESGLAQALAQRGLSSSGVANRAFMTSQGNKLEQLAELQRKIADDRMNMNLQRLGQTRNFLSQLGQQGQNAIQDQYGRQVTGAQLRQGQLKDATSATQEQQAMAQSQANIGFNQQNATAKGNLKDALRRGTLSAVESAPSSAMQAGMAAGTGGASAVSGNKYQVQGNY